jgi:hypothetical protein
LVYREGDMYLGLACRPSSRRRPAVQSAANPPQNQLMSETI